MKLSWGFFRFSASAGCVALVFLTSCSDNRAKFIPPEGKHDARILRDEWGVPHIFGKTDADAAYGLAYAECEDDWINMEDNILMSRAGVAAVHGKDWAKYDYLVQFFKVREFVDEKYEKDLSPELRAVVEAYADGITHFAALNPKKMPNISLPVTGKEIVVGAALKAPFFYNLEKDLEWLFDDDGGVKVGKKGVQTAGLFESGPPFTEGRRIGSNSWAVGRSRSADGSVRLAVNSHMPWSSPVTFYEAHVHSEQGWNMTGGTFPGGPMIFLGHDENKGWCHTINRPDLCDIYKLEINPDNPNQYKFDGAWKDFERSDAKISVKLMGLIHWTFKREMLWSVHGPVARRPDGVYAIRFAGYGEIAQLEQWFRMNKASSFDEFRKAVSLDTLDSLNILYADKEGNLFYAYGGRFPVRAEGFDWKGILPGDTSKDLWNNGVYSFDKLPQVCNPPSGFIQTCNSSPFRTTDGEGNPKPESFPKDMGIETEMTNRALRALECYGADQSITRDEFYAYKYDKLYSAESDVAKCIAKIAEAKLPDEPLLRQAADIVTKWDRSTAKDDTAAALSLLSIELYMDSWDPQETPFEPVSQLREAANAMMKSFGRLDPPWGEALRLRHGKTDLGLGGGPECLRAVEFEHDPDGRLRGVNGDCYFAMVEWDKDGKLHSESIHQFGASVADEQSPHFSDQAPLFADEKMKPVLLSETDIRAHLSREYRPGEVKEPWYVK
jgi:penicillin amidase/acyl-homoserine-lactone acylase